MRSGDLLASSDRTRRIHVRCTGVRYATADATDPAEPSPGASFQNTLSLVARAPYAIRSEPQGLKLQEPHTQTQTLRRTGTPGRPSRTRIRTLGSRNNPPLPGTCDLGVITNAARYQRSRSYTPLRTIYHGGCVVGTSGGGWRSRTRIRRWPLERCPGPRFILLCYVVVGVQGRAANFIFNLRVASGERRLGEDQMRTSSSTGTRSNPREPLSPFSVFSLLCSLSLLPALLQAIYSPSTAHVLQAICRIAGVLVYRCQDPGGMTDGYPAAVSRCGPRCCSSSRSEGRERERGRGVPRPRTPPLRLFGRSWALSARTSTSCTSHEDGEQSSQSRGYSGCQY
ncbi:hypothetical protein OH76DRAFT_1021195 [Lentinus brumalis]|uniref:Uncharacterized protein n=1 Tax=Lentinus brumalis TaxID=2498619 RepID=A0A371CXV1_9APHY|nr:hypothetical protein OH76DRAFT_1021195 [Polyporus brumalis]